MSFSRTTLRNQAKKLYKEQAKSVPKRNRLPFMKFYEQFIKLHDNPTTTDETEVSGEDFDIGDIINVNTVTDDDVQFDTDDGVTAEVESEEK